MTTLSTNPWVVAGSLLVVTGLAGLASLRSNQTEALPTPEKTTQVGEEALASSVTVSAQGSPILRPTLQSSTMAAVSQQPRSVLRQLLQGPLVEVVVETEVAPLDQLTLLRNLDRSIANSESADKILTAVRALDAEAETRFLRHASEHAGYAITKENLTHPEAKSALTWALSEEASRYASITHTFNQHEWNRLDYYTYEADGSRSQEPEFGKYHRMDRGLTSFLEQMQKVLNDRGV